MPSDITSLPQWDEFQRAAKSRRKNPQKLLEQFMQEYLESYEDEKLHREIQRQARKSGLTEEDAVALVREVREQRKHRGAS